VTVLLGNGDGSFQPPSAPTQISSAPTSIASGELNGDGKADLVVSSFLVSTVRFSRFRPIQISTSALDVLLGDGTGALTSTSITTSRILGRRPPTASAKVVDLDGDTKQDVVEVLDSGVAVLEGDGSGAFPDRLSFAAGTSPVALAVGDLNGDGKPDLAVANQGSDDVSIMLNTSGP
jgi:hypothetical protein